MMSPPESPIPFDISGLRTIQFDTDLKCADKAKSELKRQVESIERGEFRADNPIKNAVGSNQVWDSLKRLTENTSAPQISSTAAIEKALLELRSKMDGMARDISELKNNNRNMNLPNEKGIWVTAWTVRMIKNYYRAKIPF